MVFGIEEADMCEFMSWIKYKGQTLFLTDKDVFSSYGRRTLKDTKPEDWIGHGAIRAYYGLQPGDGVTEEKFSFWDIKDPDIKAALEDFDNNFKRIWEAGALSTSNLVNMARFAPVEWRERAVRQLLKQNPSNADLCYVLTCSISEEMKAQVGERLFKQNPDTYSLSHIVCYSSDSNREAAWKQVLSMVHVNKDDIAYIVCYAPSEWKEKAWRYLLNKKPPQHVLKHILFSTTEDYQGKAAEVLLSQKPDKSILKDIVYFAPEKWAERAWEQMCIVGMSNAELRHMVCYAPETWAERAWDQLLKQQPDIFFLCSID